MDKETQCLAFFGLAAEISLKIDGQVFDGPVSCIAYKKDWQEMSLDEQCGELISMEELYPDDAMEIILDSGVVVGFFDFGEEYLESEWEQIVANFVKYCINNKLEYRIGFLAIDDLINDELDEKFSSDVLSLACKENVNESMVMV